MGVIDELGNDKLHRRTVQPYGDWQFPLPSVSVQVHPVEQPTLQPAA